MKYEYERLDSMNQRMPIPKDNCKHITMNFMVGLTSNLGIFYSIWVKVYRLTKSPYFIPEWVNYNVENLAKIYIRKIFWLYGVPIFIFSNRGTQFTLYFLSSMS